jgi:hypothetical protein
VDPTPIFIVPQYKYDVFISYARGIDALTGWVSTFEQKVKGWLAEKLPGGSANVFLDQGEIGVGPLTPAFEAALSSSAILLIVLSNRWPERDWCQQELTAFVRAVGGPENARERIALVRIEDVKQERLPKILRDCHSYDFFTIHPTKKVTLIYGLPEFPEFEENYLLTLLELVGEENRPGLVTRLTELKGAHHGGPDVKQNIEGDLPTIFLADSTPDLNRDRANLRRHLEGKGFRVVPIRSFYHAPPNFAQEVRQLLTQSKLFIQTVGPFRYEKTDAFPEGYEVWQRQQAVELKGKDVLFWRRPDLWMEDVEDAAHREFVFAEDVIKCDLEPFKINIDKKLREIDSRRSHTPEQLRGRIVLVDANHSDNKVGQDVGMKVEELGLQMELGDIYADLLSDGASLFDTVVSNSLDGLIVVYGQCPQGWVRQQMDEWRRLALRLKGKSPVCAIYLGPPEAKQPLDSRPARFSLIDFREEKQLRDFVREVAERKILR